MNEMNVKLTEEEVRSLLDTMPRRIWPRTEIDHAKVKLRKALACGRGEKEKGYE